ncbi:MAG: hypothetical protein AB7T63_14225 [Planctomycetota bacterium]
MTRALVFTLVLGLAGFAWWLGQRTPEPPEGLVVVVEVVDAEGQPVAAAQARSRFADTEWMTVDRQGRVTLTGVPLVANAQAPDEATVDEAIDVRAPWYARPPGTTPVVTQEAPQRFRLRTVLELHGVLELVVKPALLGPARARVEPDEPLRRVTPIGGQGIARPGQMAVFRVRPGLERIAIVLEPELSVNRDRPVARRRLVVQAPTPGTMRRVEIEPGPAHPVHGTLGWPEALEPARRHGSLVITEVARDGTRTPWGRLELGADDTFVIPDTGAEAYELVLEAPFVEPPAPVLVGGAGHAELAALVERPWLQIVNDDLPGVSRPWRVRLLDAEGRVVAPAAALEIAPGAGALPLAVARDDLVVEVDVPGSDDGPPLRGRQAVGMMAASGPTRVEVSLDAVPAGRLQLKGDDVRRGATVTLSGPAGPHADERKATWLPGDPPEPLDVAGLATGAWRVSVRPADSEAAWSAFDVDITADATTVSSVRAPAGGRVAIDETLGPGDPRDGLLRLAPGDSPYAVDVHVPLERRAAGRGWDVPWPLLPGRYEGRLELHGDPAPRATTTFEVVAGATTRVAGAGLVLSPPAGAPPR